MFGNDLKTIRAGVLVAVLALQVCNLFPLLALAQDGDASASTAGTARPKIQSEGAVPLGRGGYDPKVFVAQGSSIDKPDIYLFHEPLIFIQADDRGRIVHRIDDIGMLTLYVRWDPSPESTQEQIRRYFAERRSAPSESWVINPLVATSARFESSRNPNIVSNPLPENTSFTARGDIQVYFEFATPEAATDFVAALQGRQVGERPQDQLVFKYSFKGVSEETCTAEASYEDIQQIGRFRELFGEGREGYAQRHQLARIAQDIRNAASTRGRCSDAKLLREMTNQAMDKLGSPEPRPIDQLGAYASLDNDLKSDLSNSLNEMSQSVTRDQDQEAFRQAANRAGSVSGSAGFGVFAASMAGSFSSASEEARQLFRDVLRKHGLSGEWEGTRYIPRTLDVYSRERMDSQWAQGVQIEYALTTGATATFPIVLTQQSWLRSEQESHEEPEVLRMLEERLSQKIEAVSHTTADRLRAVERLLADAVVLTAQDCPVLGPDWRRYEGISGRFPLGAGETQDARGDHQAFILGGNGGEYLHQLTLNEVTKHRHRVERYEWGHSVNGNSDRARIDVDDGRPWRGRRGPLDTTEVGGSRPHNNMPPYLVMNFCHKADNGD